ncbi:MAG: HNH endonuclease [candidate division NC10 bacterium]|nr:HNH endonuclease [candidate division NC10 bacterium]
MERFAMPENPFDLPLDVAAIVIPLVADVIQHAASAAGGKWGLTDYMPDIRINVGFTEILTTQEDQLRLILDRRLVDQQMLPQAVSVTTGLGDEPYYPSIPHSILIEAPYRPIEDLARTTEQVRPGLYAAIVSAGRRGVGRGVRMGHAPDMVRELARFLNRDLPQPGYVDVGAGSAPALPDAISGSDLMEGALHRVTANRFERNQIARRACIAHYGASCVVCGFSFEQVFGMRGKGFIHVHHLSSLARQQGSYTVDPIRDLRPVCPNCHAMLHRDDPPTSIDDLRTVMH